MGLDMYAFAAESDTDEGTEIAYWRKHNRLQGWMDALWHSKGNVTPADVKANWGSSFNGQRLDLTLADIKALEVAIKGRNLPKTGGFFFGSDSYDDLDEDGKYWGEDKDHAFIKAAKAELAKGRKVYYACSW
jgi:hypothetical protein